MDNPFEAPQSDLRAVGVLSGSRKDLRRIAVYQRSLLLCILFQFLLIFAQMALLPQIPEQFRVIFPIAAMVILVAGAVSVFLLAIKTHGVGFGILLGLLSVVPCMGLIVLLIINSKATSILTANGIKVGLIGANLSQFDADDVESPTPV